MTTFVHENRGVSALQDLLAPASAGPRHQALGLRAPTHIWADGLVDEEPLGVRRLEMAADEEDPEEDGSDTSVWHVEEVGEEEEEDWHDRARLATTPAATPYWIIYACFILAGLGLTLVWGSVLFSIHYWTAVYGSGVFHLLVSAYNIPGFFTLLVQLKTDEKMNACLGKRRAYLWRCVSTLLLCGVLLFICPLLQRSHQHPRYVMIVYSAVVGIVVGAAHGWLYSVASIMHSSAIGCLLIGTGSATLFLLGVSLLLPIEATSSPARLFAFFWPLGGITIVSAVCFGALLCSSAARITLVDHGNVLDRPSAHPGHGRDERTPSLRRADFDLLLELPDATRLLTLPPREGHEHDVGGDGHEVAHARKASEEGKGRDARPRENGVKHMHTEVAGRKVDSGSNEGHFPHLLNWLEEDAVDDGQVFDELFTAESSSSPSLYAMHSPYDDDEDATLSQLQRKTLKCSLSTFLTFMSVVGTNATMALLPSRSGDVKLPSYCMMGISGAAWLGNEFAVFTRYPSTQSGLLAFSFLRWLGYPFFLVYIISQFWLNDIFIIVFLSITSFFASVCTQKAYTLSIAASSPKHSANISLIINLWLYAGVLVGLVVPFVLPHFVHLQADAASSSSS